MPSEGSPADETADEQNSLCRALRSYRIAIYCHAVSPRSHVVEQGHKPEVHVQLLMAVKQGPAWIVGHKVHLGFLVTAQHDNILDHTGGWFSRQPRQLKAVSVQMDRMNIVTGISHSNPISLALLDVKGCRSWLSTHRIG